MDVDQETLEDRKVFECVSCQMKEKYDFKGSEPSFSKSIILKESTSYVMKDPFSPPGTGQLLVIGADCSQCGKPYCIDKDCSFFYSKTFCFGCASQHYDLFPDQLQQKIKLKRL